MNAIEFPQQLESDTHVVELVLSGDCDDPHVSVGFFGPRREWGSIFMIPEELRDRVCSGSARGVSMPMQCKDIENKPILAFLDSLGKPATLFPGFPNSITQAMPAGTPKNLVRAKMKSLIGRGLVSGCACGCRGDFVLGPAWFVTFSDV